MLKNIEDSANALYGGGWRSADREVLMSEYGLSADETDALCEKLLDFEIREDAEKYGTVDFGGKTYALTQQAAPDNYGTDGSIRYYAQAIDSNGDTYRVAWNVIAETDGPDESSACDWDSPVEVIQC